DPATERVLGGRAGGGPAGVAALGGDQEPGGGSRALQTSGAVEAVGAVRRGRGGIPGSQPSGLGATAGAGAASAGTGEGGRSRRGDPTRERRDPGPAEARDRAARAGGDRAGGGRARGGSSGERRAAQDHGDVRQPDAHRARRVRGGRARARGGRTAAGARQPARGSAGV